MHLFLMCSPFLRFLSSRLDSSDLLICTRSCFLSGSFAPLTIFCCEFSACFFLCRLKTDISAEETLSSLCYNFVRNVYIVSLHHIN